MTKNELREAISGGIFDAVFKIAICMAVGEFIICLCKYLYGFMKGLLE